MTELRRSRRAAATLLAVVFVAAACSGMGAGAGGVPSTTREPANPVPSATASPSAPATEAPSTSPAAGATTPPAPATPSPTPAVVLTQAWATAPLVDVATGETFRIADHAGSVIVIEPMAIWCPKCLSQQEVVQDALGRLPADGVTYVVLDIDPSETAGSLRAYQERHGFRGRYAIADRDVARALAAEFGDQVLSPPSTPMIVIGTDGTVTLAPYGHKDVATIVGLAEAHGA